jgi:hypothetical protein
MASADRFGPRRSLAALVTQLHHPLKCALEVLANRPAALLELGPLLPQAGQFGSQGGELGAEMVDLLLLGQDEHLGSGGHHNQSLLEMQNP